MRGMHHGIFVIGKALFMLAASFFILLVVPKAKPKQLQTFGKVVAGALCVVAGLMILAGGFKMVKYGPRVMKKCGIYRKMCPSKAPVCAPMNRGVVQAK